MQTYLSSNVPKCEGLNLNLNQILILIFMAFVKRGGDFVNIWDKTLHGV